MRSWSFRDAQSQCQNQQLCGLLLLPLRVTTCSATISNADRSGWSGSPQQSRLQASAEQPGQGAQHWCMPGF